MIRFAGWAIFAVLSFATAFRVEPRQESGIGRPTDVAQVASVAPSRLPYSYYFAAPYFIYSARTSYVSVATDMSDGRSPELRSNR